MCEFLLKCFCCCCSGPHIRNGNASMECDNTANREGERVRDLSKASAIINHFGPFVCLEQMSIEQSAQFCLVCVRGEEHIFLWRGPFPMPYQPYHHHTSFYFIYLDPISRKCWLHCNTTPTRVCIVMNGPEARMPGWVSNCIFDINECLMVLFIHSMQDK